MAIREDEVLKMRKQLEKNLQADADASKIIERQRDEADAYFIQQLADFPKLARKINKPTHKVSCNVYTGGIFRKTKIMTINAWILRFAQLVIAEDGAIYTCTSSDFYGGRPHPIVTLEEAAQTFSKAYSSVKTIEEIDEFFTHVFVDDSDYHGRFSDYHTYENGSICYPHTHR
jgi:hypothetical protein